MTGSFGPNDTSLTLASRRMTGYLFLSSISMVKHLTGSVRCIATNNFGIGSISRKSYLCAFEHEPPLSLHLHILMSNQLDNTHISISNITGLSPTIVQEAAIEDAIDSATTRVSEEIASALGDGQSSIANNFEVHPETFDTLIDTNLLLAGTTFVIGDEHSAHVDQVFDESSHQIEDLVHEFGMAFDLVADNLVGLQIPLQAMRSVEPPLVEEDECLETKTNIVFDGSLQRNEFDLQCQFANLQLVVTDKFFSHEILISDFDEPIGVDGYVSLIPHDNVAAIVEFFPFIFYQSSLADFGDLAMCECVTDGLPTCHWFDTGQHVSPFIPFVFRLTKYGHHVSATKFDKNGYRPIIGAQGSSILIFAIRCSSYYSSGDNSKYSLGRSFSQLISRDVALHPSYEIRRFKDEPAIRRNFTILEDVSKREIQSNDVRNDVKHVKFNEEIRHDECLFPVDPGENLFMVKLGGTVKDNGWQVLVDVCALGAKNMPMLSVKPSSQIETLGAWGDKNLTVKWIMEHQNVSTDQYAYWCLRMIYISTDEISFWVDTIVCPMNNINCLRAFECISVTGIVTCKWFKVVQPIEVV
uniref:Uncharacterized protein n=1 Tax=Solanum tuberosum TaxID=4113 RepID=A4UV45_SOLTU|nr:hypothetical protein [Solanum tuberosum]